MKKSTYYTHLLIGIVLLVGAVVSFHVGIIQKEKNTALAITEVGFALICFIGGIPFLVWGGEYLGQGEPKVFLPNKGKFEKIHEFYKGNQTLLLLRTFSTLSSEKESEVSFQVNKNVLLDIEGMELLEIPGRFQVKVGKKIKAGQEFAKKPKLETVYYLLPF